MKKNGSLQNPVGNIQNDLFQIKQFSLTSHNIDVRLWDYVTYHSYHYDENGEDPSIERGLQPNGEFILEFRHKNDLVLSKGNYELSNLLIFVYNNYECMLSF